MNRSSHSCPGSRCRVVVRWISILAVAAVLCGAGTMGHSQLDAVPEYQLKAEFVGRVTLFVDWPPGTLPEPPTPFVIGIVGDSPIGDFLEGWVAGDPVKNRPVRVLGNVGPAEVEQCHMLFIAGSAEADLDQILGLTGDRPILTVADSEGFAGRGVLINLFVTGRNVRFEINESAVNRSGLRFSSKLFRLARLVGPEAR